MLRPRLRKLWQRDRGRSSRRFRTGELQPAATNGPYTTILVDDLDKAREALVDRGVKVVSLIEARPFRLFWFYDPDDNQFELTAVTDPELIRKGMERARVNPSHRLAAEREKRRS